MANATNTPTLTRPQMSVETRAKLIAIAREAFGTKGYAATSLDDVTQAAGLTRGALYHHFASKLGLFIAVVTELEQELDDLSWAAAADGSWAGFRAGARVYLQSLQSPEVRRIVLQDAPSVIEGFGSNARTQLCRESIVETLARQMQNGVIRRTDPEALANVIAGSTSNAAVWAAAQEDPAAALIAAQHVIDVLLEGLELKH